MFLNFAGAVLAHSKETTLSTTVLDKLALVATLSAD